MLQIDKLKVKGDEVFIAYSEKTKAGRNDYTIDCKQRALPELYDNLASLRTHVMDMLDLPQNYSKKLDVRGVSFSYTEMEKGEAMGVIITSVKKLSSGKTAAFNTPHTTDIPLGNSADFSGCLSEDCAKLIRKLCDNAREYIAGKRAQLTLFEETPKKRKMMSTVDA